MFVRFREYAAKAIAMAGVAMRASFKRRGNGSLYLRLAFGSLFWIRCSTRFSEVSAGLAVFRVAIGSIGF
jgi:hypothetical protein